MEPLQVILIFIISSFGVASSLRGDIKFNLNGLFASVFTPVDQRGNLALEVVLQYAQFLTDNEISGVLIAGTAGEGTTLSLREMKQLINAWMNVARPRDIRVIVQIGGRPFPDVMNLASYAEEAGVDAILTLPELIFKPKTPEKLVYYMKTIAHAAPNTPLLYYDIPSYTGVYVDMVQFTILATLTIPTFKGLAIDNCDDALSVQPILEEDQKIFIVNATYLASELFLGIDSFILAEINFFPDLVKAVVANGKKGNINNTRILYNELMSLSSTITSVGEILPASKAALPLITGINAGPPRAPEMPLDDDQRYDLEDKLKEKGLRIVYSKYFF